jgi:hypothetical protein
LKTVPKLKISNVKKLGRITAVVQKRPQKDPKRSKKDPKRPKKTQKDPKILSGRFR